MDKVLFSSEKMDWETPGWLFKALDKIFGFELDAAAGANNAKCEKYYSLERSGLENPWATEGGLFGVTLHTVERLEAGLRRLTKNH